MVKIEHKQTKVIEEISWHQWSTSEKYAKNRNLWKIVDYGEPVDVYETNSGGKDKKLYTLDKDHAIRMIKGHPNRFYYKKHKPSKHIRNFINRFNNIYLKGLEIIEKHPIYRTLGIIVIIATIVLIVVGLFQNE